MIVVVASVVVGIGVGVANVGDDDYNLFAALNLESVPSERSNSSNKNRNKSNNNNRGSSNRNTHPYQ